MINNHLVYRKKMKLWFLVYVMLLLFLWNCKTTNDLPPAQGNPDIKNESKVETTDKKEEKATEERIIAPSPTSIVGETKKVEDGKLDESKAIETQNYSGWGGSPEWFKNKTAMPDSEKTWFYSTIHSRADERAVEIKSPSFMEFTCKNRARMEGKSKVEREVLKDLSDRSALNKKPQFERFEVVNCKPLLDSYSECDCIVSLEVQKGK